MIFQLDQNKFKTFGEYEPVVFEWVKTLKGKPGWYVLYQGTSEEYVGKSKDLGKRLREHLNKRHDLSRILVWEADDDFHKLSYESKEGLLKFVEWIFIDLYQPLENVHRPSITGDKLAQLSLEAQNWLLRIQPSIY